MKIAITGGFGFIGGSLATRLTKLGHHVTILDYVDSPPSYHKICFTDFIKIDLTDKEKVLELNLKNYDCICHLAGQPTAARSFVDPIKDIKLNTLSTLIILELCKLNNIPRILYASTFNVYKEQIGKDSYDILDPLEGKSPYSISKIASENYLRILSSSYNISFGILRMFNVYGPGKDPFDKNAGMINIYLNMAISEGKILVKGSLDRFRDFIYIDNVTEIWEKMIFQTKSSTINIGTGKKTFIYDIIESIRLSLNMDELPIITQDGTPGDFNGAIANIQETKYLLDDILLINIQDGMKKYIQSIGVIKP